MWIDEFQTTKEEEPMKELRLQTETWEIVVHPTHTQIACQKHTHKEWQEFGDLEIEEMESSRNRALPWFNKYKNVIFEMQDVVRMANKKKTHKVEIKGKSYEVSKELLDRIKEGDSGWIEHIGTTRPVMRATQVEIKSADHPSVGGRGKAEDFSWSKTGCSDITHYREI